MNIKRISGIVISMAAALCTFAQSNVTIQATLNGVNDGTVVNLCPAASHKQSNPAATAKVVGNKVVLTVATKAPKLFYLQLDKTYGACFLMTDKGDNIKLTADVSIEKSNTYSRGIFNNVKITGASLQSVYEQKMAPRHSLDSLHEAIENKYKEYTAKYGKARLAKDTAEINRLSKSEEARVYNKETKELFSSLDKAFKKTYEENKDSYWAPLLMFQWFSYFTPDQKQIYEGLSQMAKESEYGKEMKEELYPAGMIGQAAPLFKVINDKGKKEDVSNYIKGAKYVLIDFWASWCHPCRMEIPNFKKLYDLYKDKGFQIVSISADKSEVAWKKALEEEKLLWPNFLDSDGEIVKLYKVRFFPTIYLLDSKGKMIAENLRGEALADKLAELLK